MLPSFRSKHEILLDSYNPLAFYKKVWHNMNAQRPSNFNSNNTNVDNTGALTPGEMFSHQTMPVRVSYASDFAMS